MMTSLELRIKIAELFNEFDKNARGHVPKKVFETVLKAHLASIERTIDDAGYNAQMATSHLIRWYEDAPRLSLEWKILAEFVAAHMENPALIWATFLRMSHPDKIPTISDEGAIDWRVK